MNTITPQYKNKCWHLLFILVAALSATVLTACGDDGPANLKPKSQNIGADPGTDKSTPAPKPKNVEKIADKASDKKAPSSNIESDSKNNTASSGDKDTKEDKDDTAGTSTGRELSADAGAEDNTPKAVEPKKENPKSVVIPENKPTVSRLESFKEMSKEVSDNMASLLRKKPLNFTQCFQSFAEGDYARKIEFYSDNERKCWGQAWAIPKPYVYTIREESNDDILILKFDVKTMKSDEETKALINNTPLVVISPSSGFSPKRTTMKRKISSVASVFENQRQMFGMDLYEPSRWQNEFRSVFFFNEDNKDFYARCLLSASEKIDDAPADLKCDVYTHVDNRVDIDYKINFSDMGKMEEINKNVQGFLRGMMRKSNKK